MAAKNSWYNSETNGTKMGNTVNVKFPETITDQFYDVTKSVTFEEDEEACNIGIEFLSEAISEECTQAFRSGWNGWNRADLCTTDHLVTKMKKAFGEGDTVKVGVYVMMLHARGVGNFEMAAVQRRLAEVGAKIERLVQAEEVVLQLSNDGSHVHQVIRDIHDEMNDLDKERQRLLKKLG